MPIYHVLVEELKGQKLRKGAKNREAMGMRVKAVSINHALRKAIRENIKIWKTFKRRQYEQAKI